MDSQLHKQFKVIFFGTLHVLVLAAMAMACGIVCGVVGGLFARGVTAVTGIRFRHPAMMLLLPIGSVLIFLFYHVLRYDKAKGTNMVILSIRCGEKIPFRMAPAIFVSSIFSHLCGASVGREGAALQLGGSIGHAMGHLFHLDHKERRTMVTCGMAAAFSAVFGTPATAIFFSMEMVDVGMMNYGSIVPVTFAAFTARAAASHWCGVPGESYLISAPPAFSVLTVSKLAFLAICTGFVSILYCLAIQRFSRYSQSLMKNRYLRALVLGSILFLLTWLTGGHTYNGTGIHIIEEALSGKAGDIHWYTFLMKILFTALSLAAGYKGGEIVPALYIGATFGSFLGGLMGLPSSFCAAIGMGALFCGVTNSPVASLFICLEMFGIGGLPYYMMAVALSYVSSGYYGLYSAQQILHSKYDSHLIDSDTH